MQHESSASAGPQAISTECVFCQRSKIAHYLLKETPSFRLVADHAPLLEGHILIIPKQHYSCYGDTPGTLDEELLLLKQEVQHFFARFYATPIFWEHGVFRQSVFHAHLHCLPFGTIHYDPAQDLHEVVVTSQDDLRRWYGERGQYFYLEACMHALLFPPSIERYQYIFQEVLWPAAATTSQLIRQGWRSAQQRQTEGGPLITATAAKWRLFQQQEGVDNL